MLISFKKGFGHTLFTGINVRMPNFAMTIGCLPAFIPLLIAIVLNLFVMFLTDDDEYHETTQNHHSDVSSDYEPQTEYHQGATYETDEFDWTILLFMVIFMALPFILSKFRRNRN